MSKDQLPSPPKLSLLAGDVGGSGNIDGIGVMARFTFPSDIAVDTQGNIYLTDGGYDESSIESNNTIRKITPEGIVTTIAGSAGSFGSADGNGNSARFNYPNGIATDVNGNVYVADTGNHIIRKISPLGTVTTLAGKANNSGSIDGIGALARFNFPKGIATDLVGNIYVADTNNNIIRKITPTGEVTTIAGLADAYDIVDGMGAMARFKNPIAIVSDQNNNLYVADDNFIRKITPAGLVSTIAGLKENQHFDGLSGLTIDDSGNLYVSNSSTSIHKIAPSGILTTLAGTTLGLYHSIGSDDGIGGQAKFNHPKGLAIDNLGNLYVADSSNHTVRKITAAGKVSTFTGKAKTGSWVDAKGKAARFNNPKEIAVDKNNNVYVSVDFNAIRKITPSGEVSTLDNGNWDNVNPAGAISKRYKRFNRINGLATDNEGNVYLSNIMRSSPTGGGSYSPLPNFLKKSKFDSILKISASGYVSTIAGKSAALELPSGMVVDSFGNIYVALKKDHTIIKIVPRRIFSADISIFAGKAGVSGSSDGTGPAARFNQPSAIAIDNNNNLYIADYQNNTIRKINTSGVVTTLAGKAGESGNANGEGKTARFDGPLSLATDNKNSLYVVDYNNGVVRKITPAGLVTTFVGKVGKIGFVAGKLPGILPVPYAVAIQDNSLYITIRNGVAVVRNIQ